MNTQTYTVNIRTGVVNITRVDVSQGDTGRTLAFKLYDGLIPFTPPTGSTVTIVGRKPSKLGFSEACTVSGNVATVTTTLAMTQEAGKFPAELRIEADGESIGTANFTMYIEPSPHPDGTTDGTHATADNLQTQIGNLANLATTAKTNLVSAINEAAQSGGVVIDDTLTQTGQAADAKKTGDEISGIKADLEDLDERLDSLGDGVPTEVRQAILTLFQSAAYAETGLTDEIAVIESWATVVTAISLNQSSISISGASTSQLVATTTPTGGTVTWVSSDTSVATVSSSGLVTGVGNGSCTITASCGGKTATCSVTVSGFATLTGISAVYSGGSVAEGTPLDSLKTDLVVTAIYSDSTTRTLSDSDYTLSGTLEVGTSTITVSYSGQTTTFNITVSKYMCIAYSFSDIPWTSGKIDDTGTFVSDTSRSTWDEFVDANYRTGFAIVDSAGTKSNTVYLSEFDANKAFLANQSRSMVAFEQNTNAKYVKLSVATSLVANAYSFLKMEQTSESSALVYSDTNLDSSGNTTTETGRACTDFIDISAYTNPVFVLQAINGGIVLCFYDSSKTFISRIAAGGTGTKSGTIPSNAKYFRIACTVGTGMSQLSSFLI